MSDIKERIMSGFFWANISNVGLRVVTFLVTIVLARILSPSDFGTISIATVTIGFLGMFSSLGLDMAVIQKKETPIQMLSTLFFFVILFNSVLAVIVFMSAPFISAFYGEIVLVKLMRILSLTFPLSALGLFPAMMLEKHLQFRKRFFTEIVAVLVYSGTALFLAFHGYGLWSIIYGQVIMKAAETLMLWIISPFPARLYFQFKEMIKFFSFGKEVLSTTFLTYIILNIDNAIVGKVLGTKQLGYYSLSYNLASMPATNITNIFSRVSFPAYAHLQEEREKIRTMYLKIVKIIATAVFPCFFLLIFSREFILFTYGDAWIPMLSAFQILLVAGIFRALGSNGSYLLFALGKPEILRRVYTWMVLAILILIFPLTSRFGIAGTAVVILLVAMCSSLWIIAKSLKETDISLTEYCWNIFPAVMGTVVVSVFLMALKLFEMRIGVSVILLLTAGLLYFVLMLFFDTVLQRDVREVLSLLRRKRDEL